MCSDVRLCGNSRNKSGRLRYCCDNHECQLFLVMPYMFIVYQTAPLSYTTSGEIYVLCDKMTSSGLPDLDFDGNETPVFQHQGRPSSLDNNTLFETPAPVAASSPSTMARMSRKADRLVTRSLDSGCFRQWLF